MSRIDNPSQPINAPLIPSDGGILEMFKPERLAASQHPAITALTNDPVTTISAAVLVEAGGPVAR